MSENSSSMFEKFENFDGEFLKFDRIEKKLARRRDVHAFILLDNLFSPEFTDGEDLICNLEYDNIIFSIAWEQIKKLTDDNIIELVRCGVIFDEDTESLYMFV